MVTVATPSQSTSIQTRTFQSGEHVRHNAAVHLLPTNGGGRKSGRRIGVVGSRKRICWIVQRPSVFANEVRKMLPVTVL